jgi:hypothetical protein
MSTQNSCAPIRNAMSSRAPFPFLLVSIIDLACCYRSSVLKQRGDVTFK